MAAGDDNSWVFDSLICFLNGPVWNAPLQSFVEEKSLIFEPTHTDDEEYRKIHDEFKNLVDLMLGSYMEDIGITPEQFETACSNGMHQKLPTRFQENLFEQIWAANDFEMFKRMMTQKNIELQLQALELIERKYGVMPQLFLMGDEPEVGEEAEVTQEVELPAKKQVPPAPSTSSPPPEAVPSENQVLVEVLLQECKGPETPPPPQDLQLERSHLEAEKQQLLLLENYNRPPLAVAQVDDAEMKKRQEYLKAQRDKLVALKKQVRQKHLQLDVDAQEKRPSSARVAAQVLLNDRQQQHADVETLKIRKALAQRLRTEVIDSTATDSINK